MMTDLSHSKTTENPVVVGEEIDHTKNYNTHTHTAHYNNYSYCKIFSYLYFFLVSGRMKGKQTKRTGRILDCRQSLNSLYVTIS